MQLAEPSNAPSSESRAKDRSKVLQAAISTLEVLNHDTEQYFLNIGEKLTGFIAAVNMISSDLATLENLISGDQGEHASHALTCALERAIAMRSNSAAGSDILGDLRRDAAGLQRTLRAFEGTVRTFRMLGVLTRIETARLGSAGSEFGNLADDVKSLTAAVQAKVTNALKSAGLLMVPIENARQRAKNLPAVITDLAESLSSFREIQTRVHGSAMRLGKEYAAIAQSFNKLIVSMQFHDITRQQIEHVIEMLRRVCAPSEDTAALNADAIVALQSSQLTDAARKFAASARSIGRNLDEVATLVVDMVAESRTLCGVSADDHDSFFLKMEKGCSAILSSLGVCMEAEAANRAATGNLLETIGGMRAPIEEVQAIEVQMRRMGMNARVQAAQTGATGQVLGVLATAIQQLALDSSHRSEALINLLGSMNEAALRISKDDAGAADGAPEARYLEEMREAINQLHSSSERSFALINQIVICGARLREDLAATHATFSVGALFTEAVYRTQAILKQICPTSESGLIENASAMRLSLTEFGRHYTMQAERDVHEDIVEAMTGTARVATHGKPSAPPSQEAPKLEDNVEFF